MKKARNTYLNYKNKSLKVIIQTKKNEIKKTKSELKTLQDKLTCIICNTRNRDSIILPCNHLYCCSLCAYRTMYSSNRPCCAICRRLIDKHKKIFIS